MTLESRLDTLYVNRFPEAELAAKAKLWSTLCDAHFQRYIPAGATVLDIGAGYCDFINHIRAVAASASTLTRTQPGSRPKGSRSIGFPWSE